MKTALKVLPCVVVLVLSLLIMSSASAENKAANLAIVVSAANSSVQSLSKEQLRKLYLGKSLKMSGGKVALLVNYEPLRTVFNKIALRRTDAQVEAIWVRLKFSGRAKEPELFSTAETLINFVRENSNAIAYLPSSEVTADVRAVLMLPY